MNRSDRAQLAKLDRILDTLDAAEKRAVLELHRAGFTFQSVRQARGFRERLREENRYQAGHVEFMSRFTRRSA